MTSILSKILVAIGIIALFGTLGFIVYHHFQLSSQMTAINTTMVAQKELADGIMRAQSAYATKNDLEAFAAQHKLDLKAIETDLATLKANLSAINSVTVVSGPQQAGNLPSSGTTPIVQPGGPNPVSAPAKCKDGTPCPNPDLYGYLANRQTFHLDEVFGTDKVPFGDVGFSASQEKPWNIDIKAREYNLTTVLGIDQNSRNYSYNKFSIKVDNKDYPVKIANSSIQQIYPTAKFSFWNPKLYLTAGGSANLSAINGSANFGGTLAIMSYGKYLNLPDVSILQIGAGYQTGTQKFTGILTPVSFNIGNIIKTSLIDNSFVGPSLQLDASGNIFAGINASIGF